MITSHLQFFTATIVCWKNLLKPDKYKDIIIKSLKFMIDNNRIKLFGFVIMPNHIHLIWQMGENIKQQDVQRDFLRFISQQIKFDLQANHPHVLEQFKVKVKDRSYQFWQHRPLSVDLCTGEVIEQKLKYIHENPLKEKWKLADLPEDYRYSSAKYYLLNVDDWGIVSHHDY